MDSSLPTTELPSYDTVGDSSAPAAPSAVLLKPTTLYVAERFIHTADPRSPAAYEFSHSINFLSNTDRKVTLERLDYSVRTVNGNPTVNTRKRTIFDLTHRTLGESPNFTFQAEAKSRTAIGSMGIEQKRKGFSRRLGYRVCRATWGADRRLADGGTTMFTASAPSGTSGAIGIAGRRSAGSGEVSWEWSDGNEELVAREVTTDMLASLVITAEMTQPQRDALVAAWIMRLWWDLADGKHQRRIEGSYDRS